MMRSYMMKIRAISAIALAGLAALAQAATVQDLVSSFVPARVAVDGAGKPISVHDLDVAFTTCDFEHDGKESIVAIYSNRTVAVLRVLSPEGSGALLASADLTPSGSPNLSVLDLDHDGRPEVFVTFQNSRGPSEVWIYRWTGSSLVLLSAESHNGMIGSSVHDPDFIDVDGDGSIEIIDFRAGRSAADDDQDDDVPRTASYRLLGLRNGSFTVLTPLDHVFTVVRRSGKPRTATETFKVVDSEHGRTLILVNGDAQGKHRATSVLVTVNDQPVLKERDLNEKVARVESRLSLKQQNSISVEVRGEPGSQVTVLIKPDSN